MSISFTLTASQVITRALNQIGVLSLYDSLSTLQQTIALDFLNMFLKSLETENIHMWTATEGTLFLNPNQNKYIIPGTHVAGNDTVVTTLTANGAGNSFTCKTVNGMNVNDNFGIVLDNGTIQWTTISSINTTTLVVQTAASLTSSATSGAVVFCYTTETTKPLHVSTARFQLLGSSERVVPIRGRDEWMAISQKTISTGKTNQIYYACEESSGIFYVYPLPDSSSDCINFSYQRTINDLNSGTDNLDVPQEWLLPVVLNLGVLLAPTFGKDLSKFMPLLPQMAQVALSKAEMWDVETGSIRIVPNGQN